MKINKLLLTIMTLLTLFVGACQPQKAASPASSEEPAPSAEAITSPEPTEVSVSNNSSLFAALSELTGTVEVKQSGQSSFTPASADVQLDVNGQIQTGEDGRVRLDLSSGTIIRVAPSSLFTLTSNEEVEGGLATQIQLELGKIFIILSGGSAQVNTPAGVAAVQGSYLKIEFDPATGELNLTCLEGSCSATSPSGQKIDFTDGQKIVIHQDPTTGEWILDEGPMSNEDFQEWLDNNPEAQALIDAATGGGGGGGSAGGGGGSGGSGGGGGGSGGGGGGSGGGGGGSGGGGGGGVCSGGTQPGGGANLPYQGEVNFMWDAQAGAETYLVKFTNPDGTVITFETSDTSLEKFVEGFVPQGGDIKWDVTAIGGDGNPICTTETSTFTKPDSNWEPDSKDDGGGSEGAPSGGSDPNTCTAC